jgi:hypothetical protein
VLSANSLEVTKRRAHWVAPAAWSVRVIMASPWPVDQVVGDR